MVPTLHPFDDNSVALHTSASRPQPARWLRDEAAFATPLHAARRGRRRRGRGDVRLAARGRRPLQPISRRQRDQRDQTAANSPKPTRATRSGACSIAASGCGCAPAATSTRVTATGWIRPVSSRAELGAGGGMERAARLLELAGARNFCLNAGGDLVMRGRPSPRAAWRVGIQHPTEPIVSQRCWGRKISPSPPLANTRGEHIIDPHRGMPPSGVLSVTIAGPGLATADAFATAAFSRRRDSLACAAPEGRSRRAVRVRGRRSGSNSRFF